ncbi:MAG: hypothetical protein AAGF59_14825 [Pseudomonadota bacterium]
MQGIRRNFLKCGVFGAVLLTATSAYACGTAFLYAILFTQVPEAQTVYHADLRARETGVLAPEVWTPELDITYHQWSLGRAGNALEAFAERLRTEDRRGLPGLTATLLLVNEMMWADIQTDGETVSLTILEQGQFGDPQIVVTTNGLNALLNGELSWQQAIEQDLIAVDPSIADQVDGSFGVTFGPRG